MKSAAPIRPALAWPTFASATATFAPVAWPDFAATGVAHRRPLAIGRLAGGATVRQWGGLAPARRFVVAWKGLTLDEADAFVAPDGTGFYATVAAAPFEYRHLDGSIHAVRFGGGEVTVIPAGDGRFNLSPVELWGEGV